MTRLLELIDRYRQGTCPVFAAGPFLSFENIYARGLRFNRVLKSAEGMAEAALLNLHLGFEAIAGSVHLPLRKELSKSRLTKLEYRRAKKACDILSPSSQG